MTLHYSPIQTEDNNTVLLDMDEELASAMNKWRVAQSPALSSTDAIYELLRQALTSQGYWPPTDGAKAADPQVARLVEMFLQSQHAQ